MLSPQLWRNDNNCQLGAGRGRMPGPGGREGRDRAGPAGWDGEDVWQGRPGGTVGCYSLA
ncbi:hypothetical protein SD72_10100 [Leucobacter komagatae]|uniref:Uncharacterized protein n=1 Tax=Leucobacter komagatae TaxID=55969 RepID=A0A0D0IM18_9MICO|nr:hypothetical protein SD72_10100 [Leucobacter komagatae]